MIPTMSGVQELIKMVLSQNLGLTLGLLSLVSIAGKLVDPSHPPVDLFSCGQLVFLLSVVDFVSVVCAACDIVVVEGGRTAT